jgi:hypothetical protein
MDCLPWQVTQGCGAARHHPIASFHHQKLVARSTPLTQRLERALFCQEGRKVRRRFCASGSYASARRQYQKARENQADAIVRAATLLSRPMQQRHARHVLAAVVWAVTLIGAYLLAPNPRPLTVRIIRDSRWSPSGRPARLASLCLGNRWTVNTRPRIGQNG